MTATMSQKPFLTRRDFGSLAAAGALASPAAAAKRPLENWAPGIKMSVQVPAEPSDDDLKFVNQLGVKYVNIGGGGSTANLENYLRLKKKVEAAGLKVWNISNGNVHNMPEVTLNLPGRDQKIEEYKQFLRNLAKAGIYYTTYAHMGNGIWSSERETTRGGAGARAFDTAKNPKGFWASKVFEGELTHGRKYSKEEIWENFTYFIKQVKPVAEELGMRIGIHPDDPPVPELGGIPRCIFSSFDGYKRAFEIADSPNIGMCLCCGCWLEGGKLTGKGPVETIQYFGKLKKLFKIHFRNVNAPYPHFVETFMDAGYGNMYLIMKALQQVDFRGCIIGDHFPEMVGGRNASMAYGVAYMRAILERAEAEVGKHT